MRHRKLLFAVTLCSVVGLVFGVSVPASAHAPTTNTSHGFPNETNGDGHVGIAGIPATHGPDTAGGESSEGEVISDVLSTGANFSAVTDPSASAYGWVGCTDTGDPVVATPGGACDVFGVDTSPKVGMMPVGSPAANYFRLQTKIPVDYEGGPFDLYGVGCASDGNPATQPTDLNHCTLDTGGAVAGPTEGTVGALCASPTATQCHDSMHFDHTAVTTDHGATTGGRVESVVAGGTTCDSIAAHGCALPNLQPLTVEILSDPAPNSADAVAVCLFQVFPVAPGTPFAPDGVRRRWGATAPVVTAVRARAPPAPSLWTPRLWPAPTSGRSPSRPRRSPPTASTGCR